MATSITMKGRSGATYSFEVNPSGATFKEVGAVYAILRLRPDGQYDVIYVGQTETLGTRLANHETQPCFDQQRTTHVGMHQEPSVQRQRAIESDLIAYYRPPCNEQGK